MDGQANGQPGPEDQAPETEGPVNQPESDVRADEPSALSDQSSQAPAPRGKFRITWLFAAGFLGWFLVSWLLFLLFDKDFGTLFVFGLAIIPINLIVLALLLKFQRQAGLGMLSAVAANLLISMIFQLWMNATCFIPFFVPF